MARQMIVAVEEEALAAGRPVIRLEVGLRLAAAVALFQSSGYHQTAACGGRLRFEKRLAASGPVLEVGPGGGVAPLLTQARSSGPWSSSS
jgi:hypothetical protein